jgi:hypothetical protein
MRLRARERRSASRRDRLRGDERTPSYRGARHRRRQRRHSGVGGIDAWLVHLVRRARQTWSDGPSRHGRSRNARASRQRYRRSLCRSTRSRAGRSVHLLTMRRCGERHICRSALAATIGIGHSACVATGFEDDAPAARWYRSLTLRPRRREQARPHQELRTVEPISEDLRA